ncbi:MAG: DoxX family protein [Patescibacteria group bacterium]
MSKSQRIWLVCLRVTMGWMFFYAGITKVLDPKWTSEGYLKSAKFLTGFYAWLASSTMLPIVDFVNEWGLTLLGVALILGIAVKPVSRLGALLMILYYLPLGFPYPNAHAYIVDEHIIYAAALLLLGALQAGRIWGLEGKLPWLGGKR